jgi:hypothetical protein
MSPTLPQPHSTGGPPKVPFYTALTYITAPAKKDEVLPRFRQFLQNGKGWSEEQIQIFLTAMADQWPPIDYPLFPNFVVAWVMFPELDFDWLLSHPAAATLRLAYGIRRSDRWLDYGGFLLSELPSLHATYQLWWKGQLGSKRSKNLTKKDSTLKKTA